MYPKHKNIAIAMFFATIVVSYLLKLNFKAIASESISIVSIALAVYAISISNLVGSNLAKAMKATPDKIIKSKTQLGVLKTYIQSAMKVAISTLVISCLVKLIPEQTKEFMMEVPEYKTVMEVISAIGFGLFAIDFLFIWLIFDFITNRQMSNDKE